VLSYLLVNEMKKIASVTVFILTLIITFPSCNLGVQAETSNWNLADLDYGFVSGLDNPYRFNNTLIGSLTLDALDNPHFNYNGKYAVWTGSSWNVQNLSFTGQLVLDKNGNPHICYCAGKFYDQDTGLFLYDIFYASFSGSIWTTQTVATKLYPYAYPSLAFDLNGNPHISYMRGQNNVMYASQNGSEWSSQIVDQNGWKTFTYLTFDQTNNAHIVYANANSSNISVANQLGSSWNIQVMDGFYNTVSVASDSNGNPHIIFLYDDNADNPIWRYASWHSSKWDIQTLPPISKYIPTFSSLAIDSYGNPHVCFWSYSEDAFGFLVYASYNDKWNFQRVENRQIGQGLSVTLSLDSKNKPHILYSYQALTPKSWGYTVERQYYQTFASQESLSTLIDFPTPSSSQTTASPSFFVFDTPNPSTINYLVNVGKTFAISCLVSFGVFAIILVAILIVTRQKYKTEPPLT
jgi:hypothetical protein